MDRIASLAGGQPVWISMRRWLALLLIAAASLLAPPPAHAADPDPRIIALAASLGNDPAQIFVYLRDQVGIDLYGGNLRGARGTLASKAGNPLDRAALGVALLRASGYTAHYAQATLGSTDTQRVIARAFPGIVRALGCYNPGATGDPSNDYQLNQWAQKHSWIEYKPTPASPYTPFDPTFGGSTIGSAVTAPATTFDAIPDAQRHKVRLRVVAETYSQAGAVFGFPIGESTVLDQTFNAADVVDTPVTLGHFVTQNIIPGLSITAITTTYSPYLMVGDSAIDPRAYTVVRGSDYTEMATNYPLGSTLLTGVFVDIDVIDPANPATPQSTRRTLVDRIGYANRQSGSAVSLSLQPDGPPALTPLDLMTVQVAPSRQPLDDFAARKTRLSALQAEAAAIAPAVAAMPDTNPQTPDDAALALRAIALNRAIAVALLELTTASFEGVAGVNDQKTAAMYLVRTTQVSPRLSIARTTIKGDAIAFGLDIHRNALNVFPLAGVSYTNAKRFEVARGLGESVLEGTILEGVTGLPARTIASLIAARPTPSDYAALTPANIADVDDLALSDDAKARIRDALGNNRTVLAPTSPQMVNGTPMTAWIESDITTGASISTFEDGTHGALAEYASMYALTLGTKSAAAGQSKFIGYMNSFGIVSLAWMSGVLDSIAAGNAFNDSYKIGKAIIKQVLDNNLKRILDFLTNLGIEYEGPVGPITDMVGGLFDGLQAFQFILDSILGDPPVPDVLIAPPLPALPATVAPGSSPGVSLTLAPDPRFVVQYNGAELPTVFLAQVRNTGPATDTFRVTTLGSDYPFSIPNVSPALTLAPGATGEVSVCLIPGAAVASPGAPITFTVQAASTSDGTVKSVAPGSLATPSVTAALARILPGVANMTAGASAIATLTLDSFGNAPTNVALTASVASGLGLAGLPASVALAPGGTTSLPLTFTVAPGTPAGTSLSALVNADFGGIEPATTSFVATVVSSSTQCTIDAGLAANGVARTAMAGSLFRLAGDMDALRAAPADVVARTAVLVELDYLTVVQMNPAGDQAYLAGAAAALTTLRATLATAAIADVPATLSAIDAALCGLRGTLAGASQGSFALRLFPATAYNIPSQPTNVAINVSNTQGVPRVFDIAVTGVPANVTATLTTTVVTVPANYQTNGCCGSPPLSVTFASTDGEARAFEYTVTATPHDQPSAGRDTTGQLALRPDLMRVVTVTPVPLYGPAGTPIAVAVRGMNSLNADRTVFAAWTARDRNGIVRAGGNTTTINVASGDGLFDLPPFTINTTGFVDGPYAIDVTINDATQCCDAFPGSAGKGAFIVGLPFSATLSVSPQGVPPGDSNVTLTLALSHDSLPTPAIVPRGALSLPASARTLARRGNYLYACEEDRVSVIDASNPSALLVLGSFATGLLVNGYGGVGCNIDGDTLVLAYSGDSPTSFDTVKIVAFDIGTGHETAPVQINPAPADLGKLFGSAILFDGSIGYLPTQVFLYNPYSNFITQQNGNLLRVDFSTPSAPVLAGELFHHVDASDSYDPIYGGAKLVTGVVQSGTHLYLSSTTSTGGDPSTGVGRLDVVDSTLLASNCAGSPNPCISKTIDVPGTRLLFGVARQGNTLIAAGDTVGYYDALSGFTGNLTITAFDITDPANPVVRSTLVTPLANARGQNQCNADRDGGSQTVTALDNQFYAVGAFNPGTCSWVMAMVDATDPDNLRVIPYDVTDVLTTTLLNGSTLYAMTRTGILAYDYAILTGPAITASVDMAKANGVAVVPGSFSLAPTSVDTNDPDVDTYTWVQPSSATITWQAHLTGIAPGETRDVAYGGDVDFTLPSIGHGVLPLSGVAVISDQAMSIAPAWRYVGLARPASYTITLDNPSSAAVTYALDVGGIDPAWVISLDSPVTVPAGGSATSTLVLQSSLGDYGGGYPFVVTATAVGYQTSARAFIDINGYDRPTGSDPTWPVTGVVVVPAPNPVTVGRGDVARVTLATTNLGTTVPTYTFWPAIVPSGWNVSFENNNVATDPGDELDVVAVIAVPAGVAPGSYDVEVDLYNSFNYFGRTALTVNVQPAGVQLALSPGSGTPATTFGVIVTNSGTASDTFDLAAVGPLGPVVSFDIAAVTLAAGASQTVNATLGSAAYLPAGASTFDVIAQSRTDAAARARATATVALASMRGLALSATPPLVNIPSTPATRSFAIDLRNAGNVEDSYTLVIAATTANVTAALHNASDVLVQALSPLTLPGQALSQFIVDATLTSGLLGTATLEAHSLTDDSLVASVTLTLAAAGAPSVAANPVTLIFDPQLVGMTSAAASSTLTNNGTSAFNLSSVAISGAQAGDFALASGAGACAAGGSIAAGASCTLYVTFTPGATGPRGAAVTASDGEAGITVTVTLSGSGFTAAPAQVSAAPPTLAFGSWGFGTTSDTLTSVVTNSGGAAFTFTTLGIAGAAAGDFTLVGGSNACVSGTVLAASGGNCTLYVNFAPTALGSRAATITGSQAGGPSATVGLSGSGSAPAAACYTGPLPEGGSATACVSSPQLACQFTDAAFVSPASLGTSPPPGVTLPHGLLRFTATGCGASLTLQVIYPTTLPANAAFYEFGPTAAQQDAHWYALPASVRGAEIAVTIVDGGAGDSDLALNGSISDPGGAGFLAAPPAAETATPIPTLDPRLLALMSALLAAAGLILARGRRRPHAR